MQSTSNAYKNQILSSSRQFQVRITIDGVVLGNDKIMNFSLNTPQASDGLTIGRTVATSLELNLFNDGVILFSTNKVKVEIGLKVGSSYEYVLMGEFNVDDVKKTDYAIKITGYDDMIKFETPYFPTVEGEIMNVSALIAKIATLTGVPFEGTLTPDYPVKVESGFTCRELFGYIAGLYGGNGYITRQGKFKVVSPANVNYTITGANYFLPFTKEEIPYTVGKVTSVWEDASFTKGTSTGTNSFELQFENPWVTQAILDTLYTKLNGVSFLGYNLKWRGDMALDTGDIISCTDTNNVTTKLFILGQKFTYNGGLKSEISAKGQTKNKNSFKTVSDAGNKIKRVIMEQALIKEALINVAHIDDLTAINIKFQVASGGTLNLQNLLSQFVSGDNAQFIHLTASNTSIDNAVIKSAMIESLAVDKLAAGDISTTKFKITSASGNLIIKDNTIQIKDAQATPKVRVQIGKDANNDYNMYVWDATGKLMFDATGLKADGIKGKIIRDDMVADAANISGTKLNMTSVVTEINGCVTKLKSTSVIFDSTKQTLDVAFNEVKTTADGAKKTAETTQTNLTITNGRVDLLITNTTITNTDGTVTQLKDAYLTTKADLNGLSITVGNMTTDISNIDKQVKTNTAAIKVNTEAISLKVSASEVTGMITQSVDAAIAVSKDKIMLEVSSSFISKSDEGKLIEKTSATVFEQVNNSFTMKFNTVDKNIKDVNDKVNAEITERNSYIRFQDGKIYLGLVGSEFTAVLDNVSLNFNQGAETVAQITNKKMLITDAEIKNKLTLGFTDRGYFDFIPRANGNMSLKWRAS